MSPYGRRGRQEVDGRDTGPPSRMWKMTSKFRREARRLLHKQARSDAKKLLKLED